MIIIIITVIVLVIYIASVFCSITYLVEKDVELCLLSVIIVLCPILNTIIAIKGCKPKEVFRKIFE